MGNGEMGNGEVDRHRHTAGRVPVVCNWASTDDYSVVSSANELRAQTGGHSAVT